MFCDNCGYQLTDKDVFCPNCGTKVKNRKAQREYQSYEDSSYKEGYDSGYSYGSRDYSKEAEKKTFERMFTENNMERFSPIAAFLPIPMLLVSLIIRLLFTVFFRVLYPVVGYEGLGRIIITILNWTFRAINIGFILLGIVATGFLIKAIIGKKNPVPTVWIAPVSTIIATISCILIYTGKRGIGIVVAIPAVVLGLEMLARVVLDNNPIDSPLNFGGMFTTFQNFFKKSEAENEKYQQESTEPSEYKGESYDGGSNYNVIKEPSSFDGKGLEFLGVSLVMGILASPYCCLGIFGCWGECMSYNWQTKHKKINGERLGFNGTGGSLFVHYLIWGILTVITCGIYGFFRGVRLIQWKTERTYLDNEGFKEGTSYFDGSVPSFVGYTVILMVGSMLTCGIAVPWLITMYLKWEASHTVINGRRLEYVGTGLGMFVEYIKVFLLSIITCGIYVYWGVCRILRYTTRNTNFVD